MTRKPPPEGARWNIPDWTPDSSAHEQEVVQYLDQLEMLRRDLAREREALEAKESQIARLKQRLEREKAIPRESVENTERAESNVKLLREQQNIINDLEASIASITSEKTALEEKIKSKSSKITFWERVAFTSVMVIIGASLLHSIYALGSWGWNWAGSPSETDTDSKVAQAALQCVLKQRAIVNGRPISPLGPADTTLPPPKALQPTPTNFLSVGEASNSASWAGAVLKNGVLTSDYSRVSGSYDLKFDGTIVNYSQKTFKSIVGSWYAVGLRGDNLDCEPIKNGNFSVDNPVMPGNSSPIAASFDTGVNREDDDVILRFFFVIKPEFVDATDMGGADAMAVGGGY